jgi:hypothetical protein
MINTTMNIINENRKKPAVCALPPVGAFHPVQHHIGPYLISCEYPNTTAE